MLQGFKGKDIVVFNHQHKLPGQLEASKPQPPLPPRSGTAQNRNFSLETAGDTCPHSVGTDLRGQARGRPDASCLPNFAAVTPLDSSPSPCVCCTPDAAAPLPAHDDNGHPAAQTSSLQAAAAAAPTL